MSMSSLIVRAEFDAESKVWVATSPDLPGLVTEASSLEKLNAKLIPMIEELLQLNEIDLGDLSEIPIHIIAHKTTRARKPIP